MILTKHGEGYPQHNTQTNLQPVFNSGIHFISEWNIDSPLTTPSLQSSLIMSSPIPVIRTISPPRYFKSTSSALSQPNTSLRLSKSLSGSSDTQPKLFPTMLWFPLALIVRWKNAINEIPCLTLPCGAGYA